MTAMKTPLCRASLTLCVLTACVLPGGPARPQAPATDISLVEIGPGPAASSVIRVTARERYDNQPSFLPDGSLLYTAAKDDDTTDIVRWNQVQRSLTTVVATPQSEYSPTPIPDRDAISVVRDYGNQDQQLWSFPLTSGAASAEPELLLPDVNPVGYHAWVDPGRLLVFVLGEPPTLRLAELGPGSGAVLEQNPGRGLARRPGTTEMTFVHKQGDDDWRLVALDLGATPSVRRELARLQPPHEDYAIAPDGALWTGRGSRLLRLRPGIDDDWTAVIDLSPHGIDAITRLAFDATGRRLAVVHAHVH
jgi:hypothetical protein